MGIWVQKEETGTVEMQMSGRSSGRAALATTTEQPMPRDQLSTMIQGVSAAVEELVQRTAQLRGLARLQRRGAGSVMKNKRKKSRQAIVLLMKLLVG